MDNCRKHEHNGDINIAVIAIIAMHIFLFFLLAAYPAAAAVTCDKVTCVTPAQFQADTTQCLLRVNNANGDWVYRVQQSYSSGHHGHSCGTDVSSSLSSAHSTTFAWTYRCAPICTSCSPSCSGKSCGSDGCGGTCGTCSGSSTCNSQGQCITSCTPQTCSQLGKSCGTWNNGCGTNINCGTCGSGQSCNSQGQCITSCTPQTCNQLGKSCGTWSNGCGTNINCGTCSNGYTCNAGQCIATCTDTCASLGFNCGMQYVCGITNNCGTCLQGKVCSITGQCQLPPDTTPPIISSGQPSGILAAGTTSTTLSVVTNENAGCRYSNIAGKTYATMSAMAITGSRSHSTTLNNLRSSTSYNYYIKCRDTAGNIDINDYGIQFSIPAAVITCIDNDHDRFNITGGSCGPIDCNDNNPNVHQTMLCDYNGVSCGNYNLCVSSCPIPPSGTCNPPIGCSQTCNPSTQYCDLNSSSQTYLSCVDIITVPAGCSSDLDCSQSQYCDLNTGACIDNPTDCIPSCNATQYCDYDIRSQTYLSCLNNIVACINDAGCDNAHYCDINPSSQTYQQCIAITGSCKNGLLQVCDITNQYGSCIGTKKCVNNQYSTCNAQIPSIESCNGIDDNCNGQIDENNPCPTGQACSNSQCIIITGYCNNGTTSSCNYTNIYGSCLGTRTCTNNQYTSCTAKLPSKEVCNGIDDDCNGQIDEGNPCPTGQACSNGQCTIVQGICTNGNVLPCSIANQYGNCTGTITCINNQYTSCNAHAPALEACNGMDDNCNGLIDEGLDCSNQQNSSIPTDQNTSYQGTQNNTLNNNINNDINNNLNNNADNNSPAQSGLDCMMMDEVLSERTSCYYIYDNKVYRKGNYNEPHMGHPCGSDVSTIMQQSHISNPNYYLWPYLVKDLCPAGYDRNAQNTNPGNINAGNIAASINTTAANAAGNIGPADNLNQVQDISSNVSNVPAKNNPAPDNISGASEENWKIGRLTGMIAFLLLALSTFVGVYRFTFVKVFGRKSTINIHAIISFLSLLFIILHFTFLLLDMSRWGNTLTWGMILLPSFGSWLGNNISLGVVALYIFVIASITGIFFTALSKKYGYKFWLWMHRLTLVAYIFVYIHSAYLGTDFKIGFYKILFTSFFVLVLFKYLTNFFNRHYQIKSIEKFDTKIAKKSPTDNMLSLIDIKDNHSLENKDVRTFVTLMKDRRTNDLVWYAAFDDTGAVEVYSAVNLPDGRYNLKGILRYYGEIPYIEATNVSIEVSAQKLSQAEGKSGP